MRFMLFFLVIEKVATVKLATVRIAAASLITPLYLPGDTNVHPHHVPKLVSPKRHLGWFSRFAGLASFQGRRTSCYSRRTTCSTEEGQTL